jgi:hypothetical protein
MAEGHFFIFFLKYFALILIYFIIGHGILRLFRIKVPISSFVQYFAWSAGLGFIFSSVIIALIFSYGKTIALAAILPLAWFIYSLKKDENISNQQNLKLDFDLKEILLFIIFMVLLYIFYFNNVFYYDSYKDSIFRANLSNLMIYTNQETTNSYNLLYGYTYNYYPYHYMYLWNNGIVSALFTKGDAVTTYYLVMNPALLFIDILLFYSILKLLIKNIYLSFFLTLIFLFFSFTIYFNNFILFITQNIRIDADTIDNLFVWDYPFQYPFFFFLRDIKSINFLLLLLIGIYTYSFNKKASIGIFGVAPVFSPLLLTLPASYFTIQLFSKKERKVHLLLIPLFIIIYFILIKFILSSQNNINAFNEFILYPYICNLKPKTLINYVLVVILLTIIYGFIYWLSFFYYFKFIPKNDKEQLLDWSFALIISIIFFSIIATFINYGALNGSQFILYNLFFLPYIGFMFLVFDINYIINHASKTKKLIQIFVFSFLTLISIMNYNNLIKGKSQMNPVGTNNMTTDFVNNDIKDNIKIGIINVPTFLNHCDIPPIYALYISSLSIKETYFYNYINAHKIVSVLLDTLPRNMMLSDDSCLNLYYINELKKFLPFDIYWNKNYANNLIPIDSAKMNFIREQKMNYILLYKGAIYKDTLPSYLRPYVDTFYILEPNEDTLFKLKSF